MEMALTVQIIGFSAVAIELALFQLNRRNTMLALDLCAAMLWVVHYCLLSGWTGAAMNGVRAGRAYFFRWEIRHWGIPLGFMTLAVAGALVSWEGPLSLLPMLGIIIGTAGYWQRDPAHIRIAILICAVPWFIYNMLTDSYAGMVLEAMLACSTLVGIYRFDVRPRQQRRPAPGLTREW